MPFFDQHWRLRWLGAGLAGVVAVLLPLRYLQVAAVWDRLRGWSMWPDALFAGCTAVVLLGVAYFLARSARRAQERMRWRMPLLAGVNPTRHRPLQSTLSAHPTARPVTVVQRIDIADRIIGWMFLPLFIVCAPVTVVVLALAFEVLINPVAAFHGATGRAFYILLAPPAMTLSLWVFGTLASDALVPSPRFEIDQFGITWLRPRGRSVTIRWQDARLLELAAYFRVEGKRIERKARYLLYGLNGNNAVIRIDSGRGAPAW